MGSWRWVGVTANERLFISPLQRYSPFPTGWLTLALRRLRLCDYFPVHAVSSASGLLVSRLLLIVHSIFLCSVPWCVFGPWVSRVLPCRREWESVSCVPFLHLYTKERCSAPGLSTNRYTLQFDSVRSSPHQWSPNCPVTWV